MSISVQTVYYSCQADATLRCKLCSAHVEYMYFHVTMTRTALMKPVKNKKKVEYHPRTFKTFLPVSGLQSLQLPSFVLMKIISWASRHYSCTVKQKFQITQNKVPYRRGGWVLQVCGAGWNDFERGEEETLFYFQNDTSDFVRRL